MVIHYINHIQWWMWTIDIYIYIIISLSSTLLEVQPHWGPSYPKGTHFTLLLHEAEPQSCSCLIKGVLGMHNLLTLSLTLACCFPHKKNWSMQIFPLNIMTVEIMIAKPHFILQLTTPKWIGESGWGFVIKICYLRKYFIYDNSEIQ